MSQTFGAQPQQPLTPQPLPPSAKPNTSQGRDAFFDNAKFLAIILVVVGHIWTPLRDTSHTVNAAYLFVFTFHMPAFIMISGYFAKNFDAQPRRIKRLLAGMVVPYVIFETAYTTFANKLDDRSMDISLLDPWWLTWFLIAMVIWRLTAPIWRVVKWPLPVAILLSLVVSSWDLPDELDLNRVFQLLPFFVLGMVVKREHFDFLHRRAVQLAAAATLLAGFGMAYIAADFDITEFFYWRSDKQHFDDFSTEQWLFMRVGLLVCATALCFAFLALVPRRRTWFSSLGAGSVYCYLLHGFLVKGINYAGVYDLDEVHKPFGIVTLTLIFTGIGVLLCTSPVRRVFKYVVEPEMKWAFKPEQPKGGRHRGHGAERAKSDNGGAQQELTRT